jgi:hypothetical protein
MCNIRSVSTPRGLYCHYFAHFEIPEEGIHQQVEHNEGREDRVEDTHENEPISQPDGCDISQARPPSSQGFPGLLQYRLSSVSAADKILSDMFPVVEEVAEKTEP